MTVNNKLSFSNDVEYLPTICVRGLCTKNCAFTWYMTCYRIPNVYPAKMGSFEPYASSACSGWRGCTNECNRERIEAFVRHSVWSRRSSASSTFADVYRTADRPTHSSNEIVDRESTLSVSLLPLERCDLCVLCHLPHISKLPIK